MTKRWHEPVFWHLDSSTDASSLGDVRRGNFLPDPLLLPDLRIRPSDYTNSGFERRHVYPSSNRTLTKEDNTATLVMSSMLLETATPALNYQVWKDLEDYSRYLVSTR
jgi:endonuclease G